MSEHCRICHSSDIDPPLTLRENMFGSGVLFAYMKCQRCGCLQIMQQPKNMSDHYPNNYYSYSRKTRSLVEKVKERVRLILSLYGPPLLFSGLSWWTRGDLRSLREAKVLRSDRLLDIGCGGGELIRVMGDIGFKNLQGADPFLDGDIIHSNGVRVRCCHPSELDGEYDLIMMHHSFEHVWDQHQMARDLYRLLAVGGRCIVRLPTVESWAWENYGADWVQADAPRHFYLHSRQSICNLLKGCGFEIVAVVDDSSGFQILGSEKIRRGLPLIDAGTSTNEFETTLPDDLIRRAESHSIALNAEGRGDAIAVHCRKPVQNQPQLEFQVI